MAREGATGDGQTTAPPVRPPGRRACRDRSRVGLGALDQWPECLRRVGVRPARPSGSSPQPLACTPRARVSAPQRPTV